MATARYGEDGKISQDVFASVPQNVPRSLSPFGLARLAKPLRVSAFCLLRNLKEARLRANLNLTRRSGLFLIKYKKSRIIPYFELEYES